MENTYHKRWLERWLSKAVRDDPVVIVTGARQVGKSTLLAHAFPDWEYVSLDDFDILDQAQRDPSSIVSRPRVIVDEAQRAPKLLQAVKRAVDESERRCRIILSGSANLLLMRRVTESLAGRAVICELRPFTWGERHDLPATGTIDALFEGRLGERAVSPHGDIEDAVLHGWMPVVMLGAGGESTWRWLEGYVASYLERDLRQLSQIESLPDFRRLMRAVALRSGQILNQTEMGRDVSLSQPTVHRYLNVLEASLLLERLPAYAVSRTKRLIKAPKPYYVDSGLAAFLAGASKVQRDDRMFGALVETAVLHHLRAWCGLQVPKAGVYYWRTVSGAEVDFVVERDGALVAFEVKATTAPNFSHAEGLRQFLAEYPEARAGAVVHLGSASAQLGEKIFAIPLESLV